MPESGVEPLAGSSKASMLCVQTLYFCAKLVEVMFLL